MLVESFPPTFTTRTALAAGLSYRELYRMRDDGELVELSRGVFRCAEAPAATFPDLLAVAYRAPIGVICAVSAAAAHDLTDELPPRGCRSRSPAATTALASPTRPCRC